MASIFNSNDGLTGKPQITHPRESNHLTYSRVNGRPTPYRHFPAGMSLTKTTPGVIRQSDTMLPDSLGYSFEGDHHKITGLIEDPVRFNYENPNEIVNLPPYDNMKTNTEILMENVTYSDGVRKNNIQDVEVDSKVQNMTNMLLLLERANSYAPFDKAMATDLTKIALGYMQQNIPESYAGFINNAIKKAPQVPKQVPKPPQQVPPQVPKQQEIIDRKNNLKKIKRIKRTPGITNPKKEYTADEIKLIDNLSSERVAAKLADEKNKRDAIIIEGKKKLRPTNKPVEEEQKDYPPPEGKPTNDTVEEPAIRVEEIESPGFQYFKNVLQIDPESKYESYKKRQLGSKTDYLVSLFNIIKNNPQAFVEDVNSPVRVWIKDNVNLLISIFDEPTKGNTTLKNMYTAIVHVFKIIDEDLVYSENETANLGWYLNSSGYNSGRIKNRDTYFLDKYNIALNP